MGYYTVKSSFDMVKMPRLRRNGAFYEKIIKSLITFPFLRMYGNGGRVWI